MTATDKIKTIQRVLGVKDDAVFGPKSHDALESVIVAAGRERDEANTPELPGNSNSPAPTIVEGLQHNTWPLEADAAAFFGYPPNLTSIEVPFPLHLFSPTGEKTTHVTCNLKVAPSLRRIFAAILAHYGSVEAIHATGVDVFDGIYNDRNVRGSSSKRSMHAYGAAIDIDAEHNPLGASHGRMPEAVVAIFKAEGWRWGGDYQGRKDWMHFEACR